MIGMEDCVSKTMDEYIDHAAEMINSPEARQSMRDRLAKNKDRVYYDRAPIVALEQFFEEVWRERHKA